MTADPCKKIYYKCIPATVYIYLYLKKKNENITYLLSLSPSLSHSLSPSLFLSESLGQRVRNLYYLYFYIILNLKTLN